MSPSGKTGCRWSLLASDWEPRFHLPAWVMNLPELSILSDLVLETVLFIFVHKAPVLPTGGKIEGLRKEDEERET